MIPTRSSWLRWVWVLALSAASGLLLPACGETCAATCVEGSVTIESDVVVGSAPLTVNLAADAVGGSCACGPGSELDITLYEWDLDGDGVADQSGVDLSTVSVEFDSSGAHYVRVWVTDEIPYVVHDVIAIDVL